MQLIGLLGFAAFTLTSYGVGFRLLWLGCRTRQLPELTIGGSFVLAGGVGGTLSLLANGGQAAGGAGLMAASGLAIAVGVSLLAFFTWRVFRPSEGWAAALFAGVVGTMLISHFARQLTPSADLRDPVLFDWIGLAARIVVYTWAFSEAVRAHLAARRRCAIGLAEPLVANRLLLWGIGLGAVLLIWLYSGFQMAAGTTRDPAWLVIAVLGFVCAGSLWLAFFPPASYRRRFAPAGGV